MDRPLARFSAWYEMFPRSTGGWDNKGKPVHGTFATAAKALPRIAKMGFDVVYLPPIHPIGKVHRKGRNNTVTAAPDDVGSPWAIGSDEGGHDAVHPELGTIEDFDDFVAAARDQGLEVALDLALQCAPDHPWAKRASASGSPCCPTAPSPTRRTRRRSTRTSIRSTSTTTPPASTRKCCGWCGTGSAHGVKMFRVDNPHTKPPNFWAWLIGEVKNDDPDVLFLAEAFTRPARLYGLAKLGFTQSYTYFTWRTAKWELTEFGEEIAEHADYARPNLFVNTPDILHESLQHGGPGHVRDPRGAGVDDEPDVGRVLRLRTVRAPRRCARAARSTSTRRSTSCVPAISRRRWPRASRWSRSWPGSTRFAGCTPRCSSCAPSSSTTSTTTRCWPTASSTRSPATRVLVVVTLNPFGPEEARCGWTWPRWAWSRYDRFWVRDEITGEEYQWGQGELRPPRTGQGGGPRAEHAADTSRPTTEPAAQGVTEMTQ